MSKVESDVSDFQQTEIPAGNKRGRLEPGGEVATALREAFDAGRAIEVPFGAVGSRITQDRLSSSCRYWFKRDGVRLRTRTNNERQVVIAWLEKR